MIMGEKKSFLTYRDVEECDVNGVFLAYEDAVQASARIHNIRACSRDELDFMKESVSLNLIMSKKSDVVSLKGVFDGARAVGFISYAVKSDKKNVGEVGLLYIHSDYWNKGIGKELLWDAFGEMKDAGLKEVLVNVDMNLNASNQFYKKLGGVVNSFHMADGLVEYTFDLSHF